MTNGLRTAMVAVVATAMAACGGTGGGAAGSARIGPAGGTVAAGSVMVEFPKGAVSSEIEIQVTELPHGEGEPRHIQIEPRDLSLQAAAMVRVRSDDGNASDEKMVEIEHGPEGEIEHGLETEHHNELEHAREAEVGRMGEFEVRHARVCDPGCDVGFECDDGLCKPHPEDPAATTTTACPTGFELDATDGICKLHGGGGSGSGSSGSGSGM